jgi:hypothetical protein
MYENIIALIEQEVNWCSSHSESTPVNIDRDSFVGGLKQAQLLIRKCSNIADQDTKVATPPAGADGLNPSKLSDNGPAHQIDVLPLAGSPSDNTSQPESVKRGIRQCNACESTECLCRAKGSSCVLGYPA